MADLEAKRKIIAKELVEIFQTESGKMKNAKWLAQGTIYPDMIKSAGKVSRLKRLFGVNCCRQNHYTHTNHDKRRKMGGDHNVSKFD